MCTVSFVKIGEKVIITSNRDESVVRLNAIHPKNYTVNNKNVIYPKDPKAGGTWYVVDEKGTIIVLLNGA
ncbi:NRDE family protein, partial [Flavobacterium sp.]|uniref:NRDE family protein n=1 Tax=Flavobacterium sp. TaxID=239 RepID=UPI003C595DA0